MSHLAAMALSPTLARSMPALFGAILAELLLAFTAAESEGGRGVCVVPHPSEPKYQLDGADLRYKLFRYFTGSGTPPLEEVFFVTQNMTRATQASLMQECPGLLISAFTVVAEARLPIDPEEARDAIAKAGLLASQLSAEDFEAASSVWPISQALESYSRAAAEIEGARAASSAAAAGGPREVHVVVCHCRESLDWLTDGRLRVPASGEVALDLFVYEKCGKVLDAGQEFAAFRRVVPVTVNDGDVRTDECSGYLRHVIDHYSSPADYTLFFQADAGDHLQWGYLHLVMRALELGTLAAPFVHLNHPRLVTSLSPCRERVFQLVFGRSPRQTLSSYCCAQFAVSRGRIIASPLERYQRMFEMLQGPSPAECHDIPGHSTYCLMFEVLWHVVFGEEDTLPERAENPSLQLFLKIRDIENESYLPPDSLYMQLLLSI